MTAVIINSSVGTQKCILFETARMWENALRMREQLWEIANLSQSRRRTEKNIHESDQKTAGPRVQHRMCELATGRFPRSDFSASQGDESADLHRQRQTAHVNVGALIDPGPSDVI